MMHATAISDSSDGKLRRIRDGWAGVAARSRARQRRRDATKVASQQRRSAKKIEAQAVADAREVARASVKVAPLAQAATASQTATLRALVAFTASVGVVTFVLSFAGLSDYGHRVVKLNEMLSWLVPIGVDGLTLSAVAATFVLRHADWHVRLYAWAVFGVAVAASVAGNLSHAVAHHLGVQGQIGAAAWPILLALASHMVIVARRSVERSDSQTATVTRPTPAIAARQDRTVAMTTVAVTERPAPRRDKPVSDSADRTRARDMYSGGTSAADIAERLGVSKRTVERWTEDLRQAPAVAGNTDTEGQR